MRDTKLQLTIEHQGSYHFLDVDVRGCKAGTIVLSADIDGETVTFPYELRERRKNSRNRRGFTTADVVYLLMPDRFCGTLKGIREHLDYLEDLGVTAIWMTPVLEASSYHGYDTTDFFAVNKRFGTLEDYIALVEEAHRRGLKVIKDFVFNHCGSKHPWMAAPPMPDWINHPDGQLITNYRLTPTIDPYAADIDKQQTVEGWFVKTMPDLNLRNKRLLRYLTQCSLWWIETADIDGIRMDTFPYSDREAMEEWLRTIHREYPYFHVVGETWVCNSAFTAKMQEGELDSSMDFALFEAFNYAKHEDSNEWWSGLNRIYHVLCYDYLYRNPLMTLAFLDNHDVSRFIGKEPDERMIARLKAALAILLTIPRVPQLYYGTEILMEGTTDGGDENVRKPFPLFPGISGNPGVPGISVHPGKHPVYRFLRRILQWRKGCDAIANGTTKQFMPHKGIYVIARTTVATRVLTIVNGNNKSVMFNPERYAEVLQPVRPGAFLNATDIITGRVIHLDRPFRMAANKAIICEIK